MGIDSIKGKGFFSQAVPFGFKRSFGLHFSLNGYFLGFRDPKTMDHCVKHNVSFHTREESLMFIIDGARLLS